MRTVTRLDLAPDQHISHQHSTLTSDPAIYIIIVLVVKHIINQQSAFQNIRLFATMNRLFTCLLLVVLTATSHAFTSLPSTSSSSRLWSPTVYAEPKGKAGDPEEIVARRIIVKGAVQGGYYRSCVLNEAGRFRKLIGTMSPPDDTDKAEIYVEGKRKMVEGFVRWCQKGNVGLSQVVGVEQVSEEEPTGLYDGFYVKTK